MKKIRVIRKDSGLKSGSREVSLIEALKYPVYSPVQGKIYSPTKLWSAQIRFNNVLFKKELTFHKFEFKGRQKISGLKRRIPV